MTRALARFGPPVAWMGVIAVFSGELFGADRTGPWLLPLLARALPWADPAVLHGLHAGGRKLGHLVGYGILAALWLRAQAPDRPPARAALWAVGLSALYAILDELRQGLLPNRSPAVMDVAIDITGAVLAVACLEARRPLGVRVVRLGRWLAVFLAAASLAAAALYWSLGLPAWDLLLSALGAGTGAWGLRATEQNWRRPP